MKYYLSIDGGGSKLQTILFDEEFRILGKGLGGGINTTQSSRESVLEHIHEAIVSTFAKFKPDRIACLYSVFLGAFPDFVKELKETLPVDEIINLGEPVGCKIAASLHKNGMLALSGTGSDVFIFDDDLHQSLGGWGPILGDPGSGCWIGMQSLQAMSRAEEGWGPDTILREIVKEKWQLGRLYEAVSVVHHSKDPLRKAAEVTRMTAEAARRGDEVCLKILEEAGQLMGRQMVQLIKKVGLPEDKYQEVTYIGGSWKTHPIMKESFEKTLKAFRPSLIVKEPLFEPVMLGPVLRMKEMFPDASDDEIRNRLIENFSEYRYNA